MTAKLSSTGPRRFRSPRTLPERYADKFLERARRLHYEFWDTRWGPARPA
jgi:hypothetical protein